MMSMKSYLIHIFLFLYESILLRNWNQSNRIIQIQIMAFSCQLVILPIFSRNSLYYLFFWCLNFLFGTISLYSCKSKVLRVLLQLESPNSEHRNSSYVLNNQANLCSKAETRIWLVHGPTLSEFLGHLKSESDDVYFFMFGSP